MHFRDYFQSPPNKQINDEGKSADTGDPVSTKASWKPFGIGGASFKNVRLIESDNHITMNRTIEHILVSLVFVFVGVASLGYSFSLFVGGNHWWAATAITFLAGLFFGGVGIAFLIGRKLFTFDKTSGLYFSGKQYSARPKRRDIQGQLKDIIAIQCLSHVVVEPATRTSHDSRPYTSFQVNVVFQNGHRINIIDHGAAIDFLDSAKMLSNFLEIPIWIPRDWRTLPTNIQEFREVQALEERKPIAKVGFQENKHPSVFRFLDGRTEMDPPWEIALYVCFFLVVVLGIYMTVVKWLQFLFR